MSLARDLALAGLGLAVLVGLAGVTPAQHVAVSPEFGEVAHETEVSVLDAAAEPRTGVAVRALTPSGSWIDLGVTGAEGWVRFTPAEPGRYELHAEPAGELWITPYHVRAQRARWLRAAFFVPLGLGLLWWNVRRWRRLSAAGV